MIRRYPLLARAVLLAALAAGVAAPTGAAAQQDGDALEVFVELRVWQGVDDLEDIWISARPRGGDWDTLGTIPFTLDNEYPVYHDWRYYRYGDLAVAGATLRIWQWTGDLERISVCAHRCGDPWSRSVPLPLGALPLPLEDGHSPDGQYRYGDLKIATAPGHPLLLADRVQLLRLRDTLAGTGALDWDHDTPMTTWTGVTIGGTVLRVRKLNLAGSGLTGELSGLLGNLSGLEELRLDGNALTGAIPSKLGQLARLTHAYLGGNALTGCVPPSLRAVPNNDLASLGLPDCLPPIELHGDADTILTDGSYMIRSSWISEGRSRFVFDVPAGIRMTMRGPYKVYGHDYPAWLLLDHVDSQFVTGFSLGYGSEYHRTVDPAAPGIPAAFDRIIESAWFGGPDTPSRTLPREELHTGGNLSEVLIAPAVAIVLFGLVVLAVRLYR